MDLIPNPLSFALVALSFPVGIAVVFGFLGMMIAFTSPPEVDRGRKSSAVFLAVSFVLLVGIFVGTGVIASSMEQRRTEWLASQGVTEADLPRLGFPVSAPHEDEIFGTSPALVDGRSTQVRLAWEGGDFVVYEVTGDRLLGK